MYGNERSIRMRNGGEKMILYTHLRTESHTQVTNVFWERWEDNIFRGNMNVADILGRHRKQHSINTGKIEICAYTFPYDSQSLKCIVFVHVWNLKQHAMEKNT